MRRRGTHRPSEANGRELDEARVYARRSAEQAETDHADQRAKAEFEDRTIRSPLQNRVTVNHIADMIADSLARSDVARNGS